VNQFSLALLQNVAKDIQAKTCLLNLTITSSKALEANGVDVEEAKQAAQTRWKTTNGKE